MNGFDMSEFVRTFALEAAAALVKDNSRSSLAGAVINSAYTVIEKSPTLDKKPINWLSEVEKEKAET